MLIEFQLPDPLLFTQGSHTWNTRGDPNGRSQKAQGQVIAMARRRLPLAIRPSHNFCVQIISHSVRLAYFPSCSTDLDFCIDVPDDMFSTLNYVPPTPALYTPRKVLKNYSVNALYILASLRFRLFHGSTGFRYRNSSVASFCFDVFWCRSELSCSLFFHSLWYLCLNSSEPLRALFDLFTSPDHCNRNYVQVHVVCHTSLACHTLVAVVTLCSVCSLIKASTQSYCFLLSCHRRFVPSHISCRCLMQRGADSSDREVYGRSLVGIAGSNPAGVVNVFLLWVLCVVR